MQRQSSAPPIHHPVPQRPVQVPVMQSPPPPGSSADPYNNNPYTQQPAYGAPPPQQHPQIQPGWGNMAQGANQFFNDPMAAQIGVSFARAAFGNAPDLAEQNIYKYTARLRPYFAVTNGYVIQKLYCILNPWLRPRWTRLTTARASAARPGEAETIYLTPKEDINAPDMYIPLMAVITYVLLSALLYGLSGTFRPELLASTATRAAGVLLSELLGLKLGCYFLGISNSQWLDLAAYSGYKFVGLIVSIMAVAVVGNGWIAWALFLYAHQAVAFFLIRSLRYVLLPDATEEGQNVYSVAPREQKTRRTWFLFAYSYPAQFLFMLLLSKGIGRRV